MTGGEQRDLTPRQVSTRGLAPHTLATDPLQLLSDAVDGLERTGADPEIAAGARRLLALIRAGYPETLRRSAARLAEEADAPAGTLRRLLADAGFRDYEELRFRADELENQALRSPDQRFVRRLGEQTRGDRPRARLLARLAEREAHNVGMSMRAAIAEGSLEAAAARLVSARNRYVVGERKSYAFAHLLAADLAAVMSHVTLVDGLVSREPDALIDAGDGDVAVVFSLRRYGAVTLRLARLLAASGVAVIAVTDATSSPIAELAEVTLIARTASESFADSPTAVAAICHAIATLAAVRAKGARRRLARREQLSEGLWVPEDGASHDHAPAGNGETMEETAT